jgi:hypothetical protein
MLTTALNRSPSGRGVVAEPEGDAALIDDPRAVDA